MATDSARANPLSALETAGAGFDQIFCQGCGNRFPAPSGIALTYALKGSCENCGGGFAFLPAAAAPGRPRASFRRVARIGDGAGIAA